MSLFAENADVKEKFYSFKNHAIEDLNKKRGKFILQTTVITTFSWFLNFNQHKERNIVG